MKTRVFSRPVRGALAGVAMIGIAGFAAAQMNDHKDHPAAATHAAPADRKIKYYRNPMGLPDTSPVPKQDSMGMDYIPVYEGDDSDDGSVKLSPGKIQRTGVKSEPAASRIIRAMIHAPGVIQLDERRISVIAMRSESYIQKSERHHRYPRHQGPAPDGSLQPGGIVGGGRVHLDHQLQYLRGRRALWPGFAAAADKSRRSGCGHRRQ